MALFFMVFNYIEKQLKTTAASENKFRLEFELTCMQASFSGQI